MQMWRVYHLEGCDDLGFGIWRDMGLEFHNRDEAISEVRLWRRAWPRHTYRLRKGTPAFYVKAQR